MPIKSTLSNRKSPKKIIVLGAGASHELCFYSGTINAGSKPDYIRRFHKISGPLSSGFFYYANEFSKEAKKFMPLAPELKLRNDWLIKYIEGYYLKKNGIKLTIDQIFQNKNLSKRINIEEIYIAIEKDMEKFNRLGRPSKRNLKRYIQYVDVSSARTSLIEFIHDALSAISFCCYSLFHRVLAYYCLQNRVQTVSFNWDILLEEELERTGQWSYADGYGFNPFGLIDKNRTLSLKLTQYKKKHSKSATIVLKPHGSINWYKKNDWRKEYDYNSGQVFIGVPLDSKSALRGGTVIGQGAMQFHERVPREEVGYESLIVPPGKKRKKFDFIWKQIKELLSDADEITFIGFSFNNFDGHIIDELKSLRLKKSASIVIVNPERSITEKYKKLFPGTPITKTANTFGDYAKKIIRMKGMEKLRVLEKDLFAKDSFR